jgi:hypothetical protein
MRGKVVNERAILTPQEWHGALVKEELRLAKEHDRQHGTSPWGQAGIEAGVRIHVDAPCDAPKYSVFWSAWLLLCRTQLD